jgi:hypothetical protein
MGQKIVVKSLHKSNWAGMHRYQKCHDTIIATETRAGYDTGLNEKEEQHLEKQLGLKEGDLSRHSNYWKEYAVTLTDRDLVLDLDNPRDVLDLSILKANPRVCNSTNERDKWPKAEYEIYDAEEDAKSENAKISDEAKAIADFVTLTPAEKRNYLKLLGRGGSSSMSDTLVTNELFKIAKNDYQAFNEITDSPNYKTRVLLYDLISEGVVKIRGGYYIYDEVQLGQGERTACEFLDDPHNQELRITLIGKINSASDAKVIKNKIK